MRRFNCPSLSSVVASMAASAVVSCLLSGCGLGAASLVTTVPSQTGTSGGGLVSKVSGHVHGGQNPVSGSAIQLYAVGTTGYTSTATALIPTTDQVAYSSSSEAVTSISLTAGGTGYTSPVVSFTGGGGTGAAATATAASGVITSITITNTGSGYTSAPTVAISGGGTGAAATASVSSGGTGALTDSSGGFTITGDYTCPAGSYVYITATGGNPGLSANNADIALMAALGPCASLSASTDIVLNEVTTVAGAYALAQFSGGTTWGTVGGTNFATSANNVQGIANAMATAQVLATVSTGTSPGNNLNGTASPEYWQVNLIADILAACVNSDPTVDPTTNSCHTLFTNVNPQSSAPADTLQAAVAMALSPSLTTTGGGQINKLYNLITAATTPFNPYPDVYSQINDMTIGIAYAPSIPGTANTSIASITLNSVGTGCSGATATIGAPGTGGVQATASLTTATTVTGIQVTNPGSGYTAPPAITFSGCTTSPSATANMTGVNLLNRVADSLSIDGYGNVWVGSQYKTKNSTSVLANGSIPAVIVEVDPTGNPIPTSATPPATVAGYQIYQYTVGTSTTEITIAGTNNGGNIYGPLQTALDTSNNLWFTDSGTTNGTHSNLVGVTGSTAAYGTGTGFTTAGYSTSLYNGGAAAKGYAVGATQRPLGIAIDGSNDIWITNQAGNTAYSSNSDDSATVANLAAITLKGTYGILAAGAPGSGSTTTGPGTSVVYSGPGNQLNYYLFIDPNKNDTAGNPIPGAPFVWGFTGGNNPTGNGGDGAGSGSNLVANPQGSLFQYYTAASGLDYLGATLHAGAPTPLTHNADPNGVVAYNGITSNLGGFLPTVTFPANATTGCSTTPTASVVLGTSGSIASVKLVGTGTSGCTATTSGTVTLTLPTYNVPTPTTAAAITFNASGGVITGFNINTAGAGYSTGTTELDGTLSATGGTTGTNVTVANGTTGSTDTYAFFMSNPNAMVFDGSGNAWILNNNPVDSVSTLGDPALTVANAGATSRSAAKLSINYGTSFTPAQFLANSKYTIYHNMSTLNDGGQTGYIATDGGGNVYIANKTDYGLSGYGVGAISSTGTSLSPSTNLSGVFGFGGSCYWQSTTVNGPSSSCTVSSENNAGANSNQASPYHRYVTFMQEMAVDLSGNLWYAAGADGTYAYANGGGRVVEIVGLATPIVTPTSAGLKAGTYGTKP
jgi:hypothetical protein